jgi:hypothetical protein
MGSTSFSAVPDATNISRIEREVCLLKVNVELIELALVVRDVVLKDLEFELQDVEILARLLACHDRSLRSDSSKRLRHDSCFTSRFQAPRLDPRITGSVPWGSLSRSGS